MNTKLPPDCDPLYYKYPKVPVGGRNPYWCCEACGATDPQINGTLSGYFTGCSWVSQIKSELGTPKWLIWSNEHTAFWRPNSAGYTTHAEAAGRYTESEAMDICRNARSRVPGLPPPETMVREDCL